MSELLPTRSKVEIVAPGHPLNGKVGEAAGFNFGTEAYKVITTDGQKAEFPAANLRVLDPIALHTENARLRAALKEIWGKMHVDPTEFAATLGQVTALAFLALEGEQQP